MVGERERPRRSLSAVQTVGSRHAVAAQRDNQRLAVAGDHRNTVPFCSIMAVKSSSLPGASRFKSIASGRNSPGN